MRRPIIGITCSTNTAENPQDCLNQTYSRAILLAGGVPVVLPNIVDGSGPEIRLQELDGLLLSGGQDVGPELYGEQALNDTVAVDAPRDEFELPLIRQAVALDLPVLAICRGIQSLNVALGGTLYQDLPTQARSGIAHRQDAPRPVATHEVSLDAASRLAAIVGGPTISVNSFHHQALKEVGSSLRIVGRAPDGVVEAVEAPDARFLVAVQYHPEEMVSEHAHARVLFEAFVSAATRA